MTSFLQTSLELSAIVERVSASVVTVRSGRGAASGTVVAPGRIAMANHGLDPDAETVRLAAGGASIEGRVAGRDPATGLAAVIVDAAALPVPPTSQTTPAVGSLVVTVGRAWQRVVAGFGLVQGHVGPIDRRGGGRIEAFLRTSIAPFPGYSGSAVVDGHGMVIGLATAGVERGGGGVLPLAVVARTVDALSADGRIRRGFVGVTSMSVELPAIQRGTSARARGLLVTSRAESGPAAAAGVLVGDVVIEFAGSPVAAPEDLVALLSADAIGREVSVVAVRGTETVALTLTVGERG